MARSYSKAKGRCSSEGGYFAVPKEVMNHPNFLRLTPHAVKLIMDLGAQYRGKNNGDLCAAFSMMKKRGWRSSDTLNTKLKELRHYGFIVVTQYGGLNMPNLYGFSWRRIDRVGEGSDVELGKTPNNYKTTKRLFLLPNKRKQLRLANSTATTTEPIEARSRVLN